MAGFQKRRYAKKRPMASGDKKYVVSKKTTTLASLQKQIRSLQKKTKLVTVNEVYEVSEGIDVIGNYTVRNLCNYTTWNTLWPSTTDPIHNSREQMYHKKFTIDNLVTLDNVNDEEGTVNFTYMIISRRDEAGSAQDTGNTLTLTSGIDYNTVGGKAFMNLKKWKIHAVRRFTLTGGDLTEMQADQMQKRFSHTVKVGKLVKNPDGSWKSMTNSPDPSDTYYAILFSNNTSADLENPRWTFNAIHSVNH